MVTAAAVLSIASLGGAASTASAAGVAQAPPAAGECAAIRAAGEDARAARCYRAAAGGGDAGAGAALERLAADPRADTAYVFELGNLRWRDREAAEALFRRASDRFAADGDALGEMTARVSRRKHLGWLGRQEEAEAELRRIEDLAERSDDPAVDAWGVITLAADRIERAADYQKAYLLLRALDVPDAMEGAYALRKERLALLGHACLEIGRIDEARAAYQATADLAHTRDDLYLEANALYNLTTLSFHELQEAPTPSRRAETAAEARAAIEVATRADHATVPVVATWILGMITPGDAGREYLEHCRRLAGTDDLRSLCLNSLATRIAATDPARARKILDESRALAARSLDALAALRVEQETIRVSWLSDPPERALARSRAALDAIESLRDRQEEGSVAQAGVFSAWSDDYAWLAGRVLEEAGRGWDVERAAAEAFRIGERMRARALTDWLSRTDPSPTASRGAAPGGFASLDDVRSALAPDEALLSFVVGPWEDPIGDFAGGAWVTVVTRGGVVVHRLPGRVELRRTVQLFSGLIERIERSGGADAADAADAAMAAMAARLHDELLAGALAGVPDEVERLILVPDDALHRLPFAALRASEDGEPLGARYELVEVPSASLWLRWRSAPVTPATEPVLVLADPVLPGADRSEAGRGGADRNGTGGSLALARLPYAQREGEAAVRALGGGRLLIDADASEEAIDRLPLRDYAVVHFAAHAVTDEVHPERSAVLLAPTAAADGFLRSAEIAHLDLGGRTVVLASCRSGSGGTLRGEGVMSLARAFFQGRAHAVVASLWPLRDDESAAMFDRFYRHVGRGETVSEALRAARREAIEAGEPAAAWAGLVVLGDGTVTPLPGGRKGLDPRLARVLALATALAAAAVAAWIVAAARRRRGTSP